MVLPASWIELFVPGRLCLFGEHSDWAGHYRKHNADLLPGRTLVVGTEQGLYARARPLPRAVLLLHSTTDEGEHLSQEFPLEDLESLVATAQQGGFWAYAAGASTPLERGARLRPRRGYAAPPSARSCPPAGQIYPLPGVVLLRSYCTYQHYPHQRCLCQCRLCQRRCGVPPGDRLWRGGARAGQLPNDAAARQGPLLVGGALRAGEPSRPPDNPQPSVCAPACGGAGTG
jgi:hypothetical protein